MEKLIVYTVHVTYEDYSYGLDDIFPTRESAIRHAQKRLSLSYIIEVEVDQNVVTEVYGMRWEKTEYIETKQALG